MGRIDVRWNVSRLALVLALLAVACADAPASDDGRPSGPRVVIDAADRTVSVDVEVADEGIERRIGLMGRRNLAPEAGMAFVFPEPTGGSFWMKDTLIPLSIAFWDEDGAIVAILDMQPCPEDDCPSYDPGVDFVGALEVNQGFFDEHGVDVGDRVRLVGFPA